MAGNKLPIDGREPLTDAEGEVRELTEKDFARFKPAEALPQVARILRSGRPPLPPEERKRRVTLFLDPDVVERLKQDGKGWQTRANAVLRKGLGL